MPALDGLRGLALLGVLFFHANGALPGGFLGVDLFFVLSGFLITSILIEEHRQTGRIALGAFWVRRARRLLPALLSLMPAIAVYAAFFARPEDVASLRADALATLGYVANWRAIFADRSYWQLFAAPSPLEHMWSLSIEEQFYLVWPLLVAGLLARFSRRSILVLSLGVALASMTLTLALYDPDPARASRVYLGTDTRAVGLALGASLASMISPSTVLSDAWVRRFDVLGLASAGLLGLAWWKMTGDRAFLYRGGLWLTELGALVLIVLATQGARSKVALLLSWRPLRLLGTVSYGAYLWHWPINVFVTSQRVHLRGLPLHALHFAMTFLIAAISYRALEQPILKRGVPFGRPLYVVPAAFALAVLLVVKGTHARKAPMVSDPLASQASPPGPHEPGAPVLKVMVVGDSTANSLGWALRGVRAPGVEVELRGHDACTMLWDTCGGATWGAETREVQPDVTLFMVGGAFMHGISADGDWRKACYPEWDRKFSDTLRARLPDLASARGRVYVVTLPYGLEAWESQALRHEVDCINRSIVAAAGAVPGVRTVDLGSYLCPAGVCRLESEGKTIRPDGVHFDIDGARSLARWVLDSVEAPL